LATIYDVARAAGVSPKTVSRVINADEPVAALTRAAVQDAIAELGYVPSSAARAMRSNCSGLIGLITGGISQSPTGGEPGGLPDLLIVQGVLRALEASGRTLLISDTLGRAERAPDLIRTFMQHRVEGLIYVASYHRRVSLPKLVGVPNVVLANCYDDHGAEAVLPDDYRGQRALVEGLIARGHRRIAYLTLSPALDATRLRAQGYADALAEAGLAFDPALVLPADLSTPDPVAEAQLLWDAIDRVLGLAEPPTVLCFGNDRMAVRAYGILRSRGLSLPADISLAGYDNYRTITETLLPTLTSVELPYLAMGIRAGDLLLARIRGGAGSAQPPHLVGGPVVWRDSVVPRPMQVTKISSLGRKDR
jgi:LacI family transcriptional regulator